MIATAGSEPAGGLCSICNLTLLARCSLYIPKRSRCERRLSASTEIQTDQMSKAKDLGSCPDMYRSLNTAELTELLQNDDKMEQMIGLDEKVMPFC